MDIQNHSDFFNFPPLLAFAVAAFLLNLSPGPSIIFATSRGLSDGKIAGVLTAVGLATGSSFHAILAGIGVTGILAKNHYSVFVVGIFGGGYLLYLGWGALRGDGKFEFNRENVGTAKRKMHEFYLQAIAVEFFNPKTALFYLSLVPSFIFSQHYTVSQAVLFSLIVPATALPIDICAGMSGGILARFFSTSESASVILNRLSAVILLSLGIWAIWNALK